MFKIINLFLIYWIIIWKKTLKLMIKLFYSDITRIYPNLHLISIQIICLKKSQINLNEI